MNKVQKVSNVRIYRLYGISVNDYEINILTKKLNYNRNVIRVDMKKGKLLYTDKSVGAKGNQHGIIVHKSLNNKKK